MTTDPAPKQPLAAAPNGNGAGAAGGRSAVGLRFEGATTISGVVAGGDVSNNGVLNIYTLQVTATQAQALQQAPRDPAAIPPCPYPGMLPFRPEDARFFYGREPEIRDLVFRLRDGRRVLVVGPSGAGKSSLVLAGLLPALAQSAYWPAGYWLPVTMRPGAQPLARLGENLGGDLGDPPTRLAALLAAHPPAGRVLLVVDQLEEVFTQTDRATQAGFFAALAALQSCETAAVILTMRADFYPDLMLSDLWGEVRDVQYGIPPLRGDSLRDAIRLPAAAAGVTTDAALVERLLADAADQPGSLPLLQETMLLLWGQMRNRVLTLADYTALGQDGRSGLAVALAHKADATYAALPPAGQDVARRIFLRLVQFGEGRADTRRQQPVSALQTTRDDPAVFATTLAALTDARLLTLGGEADDADRTVDLAHEALIAGWPRLHDWLGARRDAEQTRRRLEDKAADWVRLGRAGGLLDAVELREAAGWLAGPDAADLGATPDLRALVAASQAALAAAEQAREAARQRELAQAQALAAEQQRVAEEQGRRLAEQAAANRRLRRRALGLAGLVVLAVLLAAFAFYQGQIALEQRAQAISAQITAIAGATAVSQAQATSTVRQGEAEAGATAAVQAQGTAEAQGRVAGAQALAANALTQLDNDPELSVLLAMEAISTTRGLGEPVVPQAEAALHQALEGYLPRAILADHRGAVNSAAWSPDGKSIVTASDDHTARVWDAASGQFRATLAGHTNVVHSAAFSPDGQAIVTTSDDHTARVWDATSGQFRATLLGHTDYVLSAAWSPDGKSIVTASDDHTARVWDAASGQLRAILARHTSAVNSAAWSPDGKRVVTASADHTAHIYVIDIGELLALAQSRVSRGLTPQERATYLGEPLPTATAAPGSSPLAPGPGPTPTP